MANERRRYTTSRSIPTDRLVQDYKAPEVKAMKMAYEAYCELFKHFPNNTLCLPGTTIRVTFEVEAELEAQLG